ncbi:hypothetical protein OsI_29201 [Oryza sativa Indica Group]|uniref:Uncharacterized protein n=1 Tax=Oryza sativa subsp. indica TaxID=39946 RepID=B8BAU3_ORYSI|nr:hypothetical protein OsI_29201 [Oryza sativa Indica Group]
MDEFELEDNLELLLQSIQELIEDQGENNPFGAANHDELIASLLHNNQENPLTDVSVEDVRDGKDMPGDPLGEDCVPEGSVSGDEDEELQELSEPELCPGGSSEVSFLKSLPVYVIQDCKKVEKDSPYYDFQYNTRRARPSIVHFQLRNLVWATTKHDVYTVHNQSVTHWSSLDQTSTELINADDCIIPKQRGHGSQSVAMVQVTTMAVDDSLLVIGGFQGELICKRLEDDGVLFSTRVTDDENAITNSLEIYQDPTGSRRLVAANNDCSVRIFDIEYFDLLKHHVFPWSVNAIGALKGHLDYSFASAWHPDGNILATGSQDTTCRLWDIRNLSESVAVLGGRMGSIRCIKFSSDGRFLATAEPVDFVHIYDSYADYGRSHEIDLFGEIAGLSFSPDAEALYVGIADPTYGGLIEFNRRHQHHYLNCMW